MRCKRDQMARAQAAVPQQQPSFSESGAPDSQLNSSRGAREHEHSSGPSQPSSSNGAGPDGGPSRYPAEACGPSSRGSSQSGGRPLPQAGSSRGKKGDLVSFPLAESPEQSGRGRPKRNLGSNGLPGADGASTSQQGGAHGADHAAESADASSARAALQSDGMPAEQRSRTDAGDPAALSREEAAGSSAHEGSQSGQEPSLEQQVSYQIRGPVMRSGISIEGVEWHSRIEKDWYAVTVFVDLLTFIYVAFFYQASTLSRTAYCAQLTCHLSPAGYHPAKGTNGSRICSLGSIALRGHHGHLLL